MPLPLPDQLRILSEHLAFRRDAILAAWSRAAHADPEQPTADALTRAQFNDHIPAVLDAFERRLRACPGGTAAAVAELDQKEGEVKHGLHRWQQGYRLSELMREWGHLHLCLFDEIQRCASERVEFEAEAVAEANRQLIDLVNAGVIESTGQYTRLQQAEAAGHVRDLERAILDLKELDRRRAALIHQAVHDLRGDVQSVTTAAEVLRETDIEQEEREQFSELLQQGVQSVSAMLGELMELARLEAGQERTEVAPFDAALLINELCAVTQPLARERALFLRTDGPPHLLVQGDSGKVRRLLQNLVLNALKYTTVGGVVVGWGQDEEHWWLMVKDTGPGIIAGPGAPITRAIKETTASALEAESPDASIVAFSSPSPSAPAPREARPMNQQPGEGIGLSIVKRLCELLDASLELTSASGRGSTFRVRFRREPRRS